MTKPGAPAKPASEKFQAVTLRLHPRAAKRLRRLAKQLKLSQGQTVTLALERLDADGRRGFGTDLESMEPAFGWSDGEDREAAAKRSGGW